MTEELILNKENRLRIARAFRHVPRVDMSIDCVIEGQMGKAFADHTQSPAAFKLQVGPFFYFAGDAGAAGGQKMLAEIAPYNLFMPSSPGWIEAAQAMYTERLISFERYSFSGEHLSGQRLDQITHQSALRDEVRRMDLPFADRLWGQDHFVDLSDYDSPADFVNRGIGYFMESGDEVIAAAYASLVCSRGIEVSLFVAEDHRRRGVATILSAHLLKWCLENHAQANWDAANPESCKLAEKLGYQPAGSYQAYYLKA